MGRKLKLLEKWALFKAKVTADLSSLGIEYPECGFNIGDGWYPIVLDALKEMVEAGWDKNLHQVKQKFCRLVIYIGDTNDEIKEIINNAVKLCDSVCEDCGNPHGLEVPRNGTALCDKCEKEFLKLP